LRILDTTRHRLITTTIVALTGLALAACGSKADTGTTPAAGSTETAPSSGSSSAPGSTQAAGGAVTLITHDSFNVDKKVLADFEKSSGITVTLLAQGDAGGMTNKLVLTKDSPLGDAVFGIDNTFASRALDAGILQPYSSPAAADGSDQYSLGDNRLTAIDYGDVCVNVDHTWFTDHKVAEPATFEDLAKAEYKDLLVVESPATSSPGLAFLLGTIAHFGADGWQSYWQQLKDNGVKVTAGWEDAYSVDFSGSSGKGARPLVVSYASSPPYEVADGMTSAPTGALLDTCFRQVEYAGVLTGAKNPAAAQKVVDWMLSAQFQAQIPESMYVYPVDRNVKLPATWEKYAPVAKDPATLPAADISANREAWVGSWSDLMEG
jgi:thiamine transport system substrate-binding protein